MRPLWFLFVFYFGTGFCTLWNKGIVHYVINKIDYDMHSEDIITKAFRAIESEICIKFFNTPWNYTADLNDKILYIHNPTKKKACTPNRYDFNGSVVDMAIGYKCLNLKDIAATVVDMIRSGIEDISNNSYIDSYDLIKKYKQYELNPNVSAVLSSADRNYINSHYYHECMTLVDRQALPPGLRRADKEDDGLGMLSADTQKFYNYKLWPLGVVMYGVDTNLVNSKEMTNIRFAMSTIELSTCVVFQGMRRDNILIPNGLLWFGEEGKDVPELGYVKGNQTINVHSMAKGAHGHTSHILNNLMRALGVPMMSNRYDRDNYVYVNWKNVEKGKEYLLERTSKAAWLEFIPYDFDSVTHAPANFACANCQLGGRTVVALQDQLWQRTLAMGHKPTLSATDIETLNLLYGKECSQRLNAKIQNFDNNK